MCQGVTLRSPPSKVCQPLDRNLIPPRIRRNLVADALSRLLSFNTLFLSLIQSCSNVLSPTSFPTERHHHNLAPPSTSPLSHFRHLPPTLLCYHHLCSVGCHPPSPAACIPVSHRLHVSPPLAVWCWQWLGLGIFTPPLVGGVTSWKLRTTV